MLSILQPKASLSSSAIKTEVFGILLPTDIVIAIKHAEDNASEKFIFSFQSGSFSCTVLSHFVHVCSKITFHLRVWANIKFLENSRRLTKQCCVTKKTHCRWVRTQLKNAQIHRKIIKIIKSFKNQISKIPCHSTFHPTKPLKALS